MKQKGSFFSGIMVFFLVIIIFGGVGFLGYNIIFKGSGNMAGMNATTDTNMTTDSKTTDMTKTQGNTSTTDSMNMSNTSTTTTQSNYKLDQVNIVLQNKDSLDKALVTVKDALKLMTLDPYAVDTKAQDAANAVKQGTSNNQQNGTTAATTQGNTTVNVYTAPNSQAMQSMGQTYDTGKMQQLHTGLYKVSVGMQLLDQLKDNIAVQIEQASVDVKDPVQYYLNQYYTTVSNKNKLTNALTYINEAAELININPYIGANGVIYDKERMGNLHDSIYKLAEGVVDLNKLNDNLLRQSVQVGNLAQNYSNQTQTNNMDMTSNPLSSLLSNISFGTIATILLIVFVIVFILALLGSVMNLFKAPKNPGIKE